MKTISETWAQKHSLGETWSHLFSYSHNKRDYYVKFLYVFRIKKSKFLNEGRNRTHIIKTLKYIISKWFSFFLIKKTRWNTKSYKKISRYSDSLKISGNWLWQYLMIKNKLSFLYIKWVFQVKIRYPLTVLCLTFWVVFWAEHNINECSNFFFVPKKQCTISKWTGFDEQYGNNSSK